ncbi:DUF2949 domain-containing protein [Gloeobacter morelensis]|uniref:DUF2949 domain-containing protein n=1 Tax=Gloeobacter morelensis MG652769 TaxID=2781736 RepID=A0ABY3PFY9_9CYAN|nr:DUF2949 domain-containing protein [Gloeobacter morelensis]UFP92565.1 DUF2949 domain-containing protein [Gloeobacter morelensis MG652769]
METPAVETYLLTHRLLTEPQLVRARELVQLWQGSLPIVLWKLGLIDLNTFAILLEL